MDMSPVQFLHVLGPSMEEPCRWCHLRRCLVAALRLVGTSATAWEAPPEASQATHYRTFSCQSHLPDREEVELQLFYAFFSRSRGFEASAGSPVHSATGAVEPQAHGDSARTKRTPGVIGPSPELTKGICQLLDPLPPLPRRVSTSPPPLVAEAFSRSDGELPRCTRRTNDPNRVHRPSRQWQPTWSELLTPSARAPNSILSLQSAIVATGCASGHARWNGGDVQLPGSSTAVPGLEPTQGMR